MRRFEGSGRLRDPRKVSQEVRAPFCILPDQLSGKRGTPLPLIIVLTVVGVAVTALGIWSLIESLPDYSVSLVIIMVGIVPLLMAAKVVHRLRTDTGYWLGCDHETLIVSSGRSIRRWKWSEIDAFRITETMNNEFRVTHREPRLGDKVDFVQSTAVNLFSVALDGTTIDIPFHIFMSGRDRAIHQAENFVRFLNDVRHRGLNGGLAKGAAPFVAPAEFNIVPMSNGEPAIALSSAVQRR